jgi:hypothetical protein
MRQHLPRCSSVFQAGAGQSGVRLLFPEIMKTLLIFVSLPVLAESNAWRDSATGKTWASSDNGSAVSWTQAGRYCQALTLGGFHDWTLPSIDDLQKLVAPTGNTSGFRIAAPIKLTGWAWSSSPGAEPGEAWALDFGDGARASVVMGDSGLNRALCVRRDAGGSR